MAAAQKKPKSGQKSLNDERPNRKAWKKGKARGSRPGPALSEVQKVLMGQGMIA